MGHLSPLLKQATDVMAVRGEGVYVFDPDGRRYLDFTAGIGVTSTGHCHPKVVAAAQRQVATIIHAQYTTVMHPGLLELSDRLVAKMPDGIDAVFFANAGSESVEAALRLARHATGRPNIVVFHGGFHGRTIGAASMTTSRTTFRSGLEPLMGGVTVAPFPYAYRYGWDSGTATQFCLRELDYLLATVSAPEDTAAFFVEPVLGEGGYVPANEAFLRGLRERCDRHGILLVVDEIQTGVGRTGQFWGHDHFRVRPDIVITAKGLASGFPLSGMAASRDLMRQGRPGSQGGTYGGNAVACAAALATLEVIEEEDLVARAAGLGRVLASELNRLAAEQPAIGDVRGLGLMVGVEFTDSDGQPDVQFAVRVQQEARDAGLLFLTCGTYGNVVRWLPPLVVTDKQLTEALEIFAAAVEKVAGR
jgi:4-aminobutyrate aminotransferase